MALADSGRTAVTNFYLQWKLTSKQAKDFAGLTPSTSTGGYIATNYTMTFATYGLTTYGTSLDFQVTPMNEAGTGTTSTIFTVTMPTAPG